MAKISYAEEGQEAEGATMVYQGAKMMMGLVPNILKIVGHSGPVTQAFGGMITAYFTQLELDPALREMAYLTAARYNGCDYCQSHHVPMDKEAGLDDTQIALLGKDGFDSDEFSAVERAVIRFAYETTENVTASDDIISELKAHLSEKELVELTFVVAMANFVQRIGKNLGIELDG